MTSIMLLSKSRTKENYRRLKKRRLEKKSKFCLTANLFLENTFDEYPLVYVVLGLLRLIVTPPTISNIS
jgi:hypothetical protein